MMGQPKLDPWTHKAEARTATLNENISVLIRQTPVTNLLSSAVRRRVPCSHHFHPLSLRPFDLLSVWRHMGQRSLLK